MGKVSKRITTSATEQTVTNTIGEIVENKVGGIPKLITPIEFKTRNQKRLYKAIESHKNNIVMVTAMAIVVKTQVEFVPIENAAPGFRTNQNFKYSPII